MGLKMGLKMKRAQRKRFTLQSSLNNLIKSLQHAHEKIYELESEVKATKAAHAKSNVSLCRTMHEVSKLMVQASYSKYYFKGFCKTINEMDEALFYRKHQIVNTAPLDSKVCQ